MRWQPISEAPKDGTPVRAGAESRIGVIRSMPWPVTSGFIDGKWCTEIDGEWKPYEPQPTHFQNIAEEQDT